MKTYFLLFTVLSVWITDPAKIGKINRAKEAARKAYLAGDYEKAVNHYRYLTDSLHVTEDEVTLNLANAYFNLSDTANAIGQYQSLVHSTKPPIRAAAQQQLGVIKNKQGEFEEALTHFKEAIKADPKNEDARYNYEMLKRKLDEQKKQEQQQKDPQQDKKDQQKKDDQKKDDQKKEQDKKDQEKKDQEDKKDNQDKPDQKKDQEKDQSEKEQKENFDKKENKPSSEKLEHMKISEEKARMILEAMKNQEIQYLQQNKRKATQPKDKNKPDW
jgi:Ca-activated chloride channel homolog